MGQVRSRAHGNFGLSVRLEDQIRGFAKELAGEGYLTVVPQYDEDNKAHLNDTARDRTRTDGIATLDGRPDQAIHPTAEPQTPSAFLKN